MRSKYIVIALSVVAALAAVAVVASAGNPDNPPGPPEMAYSYTLEDIFNRLSTGAAGTAITFTEPISGPMVGTGHTLNEIMAVAPQVDDSNGATTPQVVSGATYWGLRSGAWGLQTGTAAAGGNVTGGDGQLTFAIPDGFYTGSKTATAGDLDLAAANIRSGVSIFGVAGDPNVVNTASADVTAADILSGRVAWADGSEVTGNRAYAPVPKTGQTISYATGDDGDLEMGVDWPSPRFTDNGDGTVTDNLTGLVWLKNANCAAFFSGDATAQNSRNWSNALTAANSLAGGYCGLTDGSSAGDWRLPNVRELQTLIDYGEYSPALPDGHPFTGVQSGYYWMSTTRAVSTSSAWSMRMDYGNVYDGDKDHEHYVWAVRGGQ
jgi:hypothetical protein